MFDEDGKIDDVSWVSETNWAIATGSLQHCVTFESSPSSADDGDGELDATAQDCTPKSALILCPPSHDSGPCEIKINFAQKYEVRQIYVRSTARVYEIYSASKMQSSDEYLCTVRCGIAARDGEVLHAPDFEVVTVDSLVSNKKSAEETKGEEDWVEVKVSDTPLVDVKSTLNATVTHQVSDTPLVDVKSTLNATVTHPDSTKHCQDYFEATAEISDANPCISITIRLLSLQSKSCIYVDEIYVFADPIASTDSESQESHNENLSGTSFMAMFLPTLMQLSRTKGTSHINDRHLSVRKEKQDFPVVDSEETYPGGSLTQLEGKASTTDSQREKLQELNRGSAGSSHLEISSQAPSLKSNHCDIPLQVAKLEKNHSDMPSQVATVGSNYSNISLKVANKESNHGDTVSGNVERALEQLTSRMDRIEEICLGFQDKLLTPMNNMEARLQLVEQQLGTLTEKLQNSRLPSCSRISAPDGYCSESDANSSDNCHDISDLVNTSWSRPGLVVTAPEFPDGEDEEEINDALASEFPEVKSLNNEERKSLSINDALASALAGFVSSVSVQPPRYVKSLIVSAPEFLNEHDDNENSNSSPRNLCDMGKNDLVHIKDSQKIDCIPQSTSSDSFLESGEKVNRDPNNDYLLGNVKEAEACSQLCVGKVDHDKVGVKAGIIAAHYPGINYGHILEENKNAEIEGGLCSNASDATDEMPQNQIYSNFTITQGGVSAISDPTVVPEVSKKEFHVDIVENVLGFSRASSVINFEIPLLDVKFISQKNPNTKPFLEALLLDTPETNIHISSVKESSDNLAVKDQLKSNDDLSINEQHDLVSVDNGEAVIPATDDQLLVFNDCCTLIDVPVHYCTLINVPVLVEDDNALEDPKCVYEGEEVSSSLI